MQKFILFFLASCSLFATSKQEWLEMGKEEMEKGHFESARIYFEKALSLDANYAKAIVELGILSLKEEKYSEAFDDFQKVEVLCPCKKKNLEALDTLGHICKEKGLELAKEIRIYDILTHCEPQNADYWFYYGHALYRGSQLGSAEIALTNCLEIAPHYAAAEILLGYIDYQKGDFVKAREIFEKYPNHPDAKEGLTLLKNKPLSSSQDEKLQGARKCQSEGQYFLTSDEYIYLAEEGSEANYWPTLLDVQSHTHPGILFTTNYVEAKENNPSLRAPAAKDYYFLNTVTFRIPVTDLWRLDLKQIYYHQRENDLFPPKGVNYSADSAGGEILSRYFFYKHFRWDLSLRGFQMWGRHRNVTYPFRDTTRLEPGTTLFYNDGTHFFFMNGHRESYIFKNFSTLQAKLLATDYISGGYGFQTHPWILVKLQLQGSYIFIRDSLHNRKNQEKVTFTMGLPLKLLKDHFFGIYQFEHGHYQKLNQNYYNYLQQYRHTLGFRFHYPLTEAVYWQATFEHRWQTTHNLFQPIGNLILAQAKQYLASNKISSRLGVKYKDWLDFFLEGHYFRDTLPYRDWNLNGALLFQF